MKKKYTPKELKKLEREMRRMNAWSDADHTVSFNGPTSVRFPKDTLKKLHAIAQARNIPIYKLVNEYIKPFIKNEYALLVRTK